MAKVLIIEDDRLHLDFLSDAVRYGGYTPVLAQNASQAARQFNENKIDLIITDIHLPGLSGLDFVKSVRIRDKQIPFIVVTGLISDENEEMAEDLNVSEYISKPVDPDVLLKTLSTILK